jgi:hypothetical protein
MVPYEAYSAAANMNESKDDDVVMKMIGASPNDSEK